MARAPSQAAIDYVMLQLERQSMARTAGVKAMLREAGREDLLAEFEAKLRDIHLGVDGARATWHSISPAQRRVLVTLETGRKLARYPHNSRYTAIGQPCRVADVCGLPTVRNLIARGLLDCEGGAFDPESQLALSDRARFVLKHGRPLPDRRRGP